MKKQMGTDNKKDARRELHVLRGYRIQIECSQGFQARRLPSFDPKEEALISIKLVYAGSPKDLMGAGGDTLPSPFIEEDPYLYKWIGSPFPEDPKNTIAYGISRDQSGQLWCTYYNELYLKDADIYDKGFQIQFEVNDILARKNPEVRILFNEEMIYQECISQAGLVERTFDIRNTGERLLEYIRDIRRQQKKLLRSFSGICRTHGLRWYMICGGLIGTLRDGGLIPWDDDLDVAMPREDFDRLLQLPLETFESAGLYLLHYDAYGGRVFVDFMTRLLNMQETIIGDPFGSNGEEGRADIHFHLPMDIYVLDHAAKSSFRQKLTSYRLLILYGLALGHRVSFDPEKKRKNTSAGWYLGNILRKIGEKISLGSIFRWYEQECSRKRGKGDYYYLSNGYYQCFVKKFPKEWFSAERYVSLLEQEIPIPGKAESFLNEMYGDYRRYPPVWNRTPEFFRTEWFK